MVKRKKTKPESENILSIEIDALDDEWQNQPKLYGQYATKLANARKDYDAAKSNLELVEAELYDSIQKNPDRYKLEKTTEKAIANTILTQEKYKKEKQNLLNRKHTVDLLAAVVSGLDHKKKALEKLVDLRLADYFSEPKPKSRSSARHVEDQNHRRASRKALKKRK